MGSRWAITFWATSGCLFWLSLARASNRVTRRRRPTVPFAMRRVPSSSSSRLRPPGPVVLEVVGEALEHGVVLVVGQDLGRAVEVGGDVVPGGDEVARRVPAGGDVVVRPLDDHEDLVLPELVQRLVGTTEVAHERDARRRRRPRP